MARHPQHRLAIVIAATLVALVSQAPASAAAAGFVSGWGEDHTGELGNGSTKTTDVPVAASSLSGVVALAAGGKHSVALLGDGAVDAWGANVFGQLCTTAVERTSVPVPMAGVSGVTAIAAGSSHTVLLANGTVETCGENNLGQLGDGHIGGGSGSFAPVPVVGLSGVKAISASGDSSLALLANGTVMAWGYNAGGELGDGNTVTSDVPVHVLGLSGVTAISSGHRYELALLENGTVMAWGENNRGQLGDGTTTNRYTPVAVSGLAGVSSISAGGATGLALLRNGTIVGWGDNRFGELGNGTTVRSLRPIPVPGVSGVRAVSSGGGGFSLALLDNGGVLGWGANFVGQLGDGTLINSSTPVPVTGLGGVAGIFASEDFALAFGSQPANAAAPSVSDAQPKLGPVAGGTLVTISGAHLGGATSVRFGSVPAASFRVASETSITAVAPAQSAGVAAITVTTPVASTVPVSVGDFRVTPTVLRLGRDSGAPGASVSITGSGFVPGKGTTSFDFDSTAAASVTCASSTSCTVLAPPHARGNVVVRATVNSVSSPKTSGDHFAYR